MKYSVSIRYNITYIYISKRRSKMNMSKIIKVSGLSVLTVTMLHATNGDNMIGVGTQSRAMGGIGVGIGVGTDSVFRNPAWIVDLQGFNASFGATAFMPDVQAKVGPIPMAGNGEAGDSKADFSIIPSVSHSDHINEDLAYGVGMFGVSGMGADYRNADPNKGLANMRTSLQYMRFVPSISYKFDNLRFGAGLSLAYGSLNLSALTPNNPMDPTQGYAQRGGGVSEDYGVGGQVGIGYYVMPGLTLGAYYQTMIKTKYEDVFDFNNDGVYEDLELSQPAEACIGIGYSDSYYGYTVSFDYRRIFWSDADGYDAFQWDDQDVFAVGAAYQVNGDFVIRAGYNYAKSPLHNKTFKASTVAGVPFGGFNVAYFNTLGFPAYSDSHFTAGLSYELTKTTGFDLAYVYAPEVTEKQAATMMTPALEASNQQTSVSATLRFKF
jgi:long-chain fatty acid transport protein